MELELNKEYTYSQICESLGWEQKAGNSKKAQVKEIEEAYEFYHPVNEKTHQQKKTYVFTRQIRDIVKPSKSNCGGAHNIKNIQIMIDFLQAKTDIDDEWHHFTDWFCDELGLMRRKISTAVYHEDNENAVCEELGISDGRLIYEYVSAAKAELKSMFLNALKHLERTGVLSFREEIKFTYEINERSNGYVITGCLNEAVKEIETAVCNDMNEEHNLSRKMRGRQMLKLIYSRKKLRDEFNEFCLYGLNDRDDVVDALNGILRKKHDERNHYERFNFDAVSICSKRPLTDYCRGIIVNITTKSDSPDLGSTQNGGGLTESDLYSLATALTNRVREKARKAVKRNYPKFMKISDLEAIEKALFVYYNEDFVEVPIHLTAEDIERMFRAG